MPKKASRAPFELVKARTGRYNVETVERALELRRRNAAAWKKLPAQLRRETLEAEKLTEQVTVRLDPAIVEQATARMGELPRLLKAAVSDLHPKMRTLLEREPARKARKTLPELQEISTWVADCQRLPGKRGPHGPSKDEAKKTYFRIGQAVEKAIPTFQQVIQFRRSLRRATRANHVRLEAELAKAGFSQPQIEAGILAKTAVSAARSFIAQERNLSVDVVKNYHLAYRATPQKHPAR